MVCGHLEQVAEQVCRLSLNPFVIFRRTMIPYPTPPNCSHIDGGDGEWMLYKRELG